MIRRKAVKEAAARSHNIDVALDEEREKRQREIQLLTLGSAGSGKSTFSKQLRILYGDGYPDCERIKFQSQVYYNIRRAIQALITAMKTLRLEYENPEIEFVADDLCAMESNNFNGNCCSGRRITDCKYCQPINQDEREKIKSIWKDGGIQRCFLQRHKFHLAESSKYFLDDLHRVSAPGYLPTLQDILYIRTPTVGVVENIFRIDDVTYRVIDVAGQKSHRKKWIHCFDSVTALIFFTSLSGFNELVDDYDDNTTNCLRDSLALFKDIARNVFLKNTDFILFLNKHDLFVEKLKIFKLKDSFIQYDGDNDTESATDFIQEEFMSRKPDDKTVYPHVTCATNTEIMKTVIIDVMDIIILINMRKIRTF
ncbi:guanine nucleotide-binding protein subunit alpha-14-like [Ptychodera flava]|uniref:guanine nucleotide-binding protein subunit alpha-14-like n=1 Tax=Ptychodera flava TaxID=63121 RepID=UPI00396A56BF